MANTIGSTSYTRQVTTAVPETLEWYTTVTKVDGDTVITYYMNFTDACVSQVDTVSIDGTPPASDVYYQIKIVGTTETRTFSFLSAVADALTAAQIAQELADIVNTHADVVAVASAATVVITAAIAGDTFTTTVDCRSKATDSQVGGEISVVNTTAASGTPKTRKLFELSTGISVNSSQPRLDMDFKAFNGAAVPVQLGSTRSLTANSSQTIDTYIAAA